MNASDVLVERLIAWGVDTIFGLPGDGINGVFEALRNKRTKFASSMCVTKKPPRLWRALTQIHRPTGRLHRNFGTGRNPPAQRPL